MVTCFKELACPIQTITKFIAVRLQLQPMQSPQGLVLNRNSMRGPVFGLFSEGTYLESQTANTYQWRVIKLAADSKIHTRVERSGEKVCINKLCRDREPNNMTANLSAHDLV